MFWTDKTALTLQQLREEKAMIEARYDKDIAALHKAIELAELEVQLKEIKDKLKEV